MRIDDKAVGTPGCFCKSVKNYERHAAIFIGGRERQAGPQGSVFGSRSESEEVGSPRFRSAKVVAGNPRRDRTGRRLQSPSIAKAKNINTTYVVLNTVLTFGRALWQGYSVRRQDLINP